MPKQKSGVNRRRRRGWTASTAALTALGASFATMQRPAFAEATTSAQPPVVLVGTTPWVQVSSAEQLEYIDLNQTATISAGSTTTYLNAHIELMGNIAITSAWTPLSTFTGTFDGQGYEITGLNVRDSNAFSIDGFVGKLDGMIKHLGVEITVSGGVDSTDGGLAGVQGIGSTITDSYVIVPAGGTVSGVGYSSIGGLVGVESTYATITNSYAIESVTGGIYTGGLVGYLDDGATITDSYAIGSVSADSDSKTGGLVGHTDDGTITDSYAIGFYGGGLLGGLVGESSSYAHYTDLYYDSSFISQAVGTGGSVGTTGLTDVQMKQQPSYIGWDFTNTWGINPAVNSGYPYLRANMPATFAPHITSFDSTRDIRPGTLGGTTSLTLTPNVSGDTFDVLLYSDSMPVPNYLSVPPSGATPYTSGSNLAATIGENLDVYELNSNGQVEAYIGLFQLTSAEIAIWPIEIATTPANNGEVSAAYSDTLHASGGDGNYTWSLAIGAPSWLNIDSSTGALSGTPTASGAATFTVNVVDGSGGSTSHAYTINISPATPLSSNANLSGLTLDQGTLTPGFAASMTSYTTNVPYGVTSVNVTPTAADSTATLTVRGTAATSGSAVAVPLNVGSNTITVIVRAQDQTTQRTYRVTVTREAPLPTGLGGGTTTGNGPTSWLPTVFQQFMNSIGGTWSASSGNTTFNIQVPAGAFSSPETMYVTAGSVGDLVNKIIGLSNSNVAGLFGISFSGSSPTQPVTVAIENPTIPAGAVVYKLNSDGSLTPVKATVSQGKAVVSFTTDPDFVILSKQSYQRVITLGNKVSIVPSVVADDAGKQTTGMPIWYVMNLLQSLGINSTWDGHNWRLITSNTADMSSIQSGKGIMSVYLNGTLVQKVTGVYAKDPYTGKTTTYMPIWYVMQLLNCVGLQSNWDGTTWSVTQQKG